MLEVHPPHGAIHAWKDFFIHIATITIGLLIAVGLEQFVEHLHHRHQVREMTTKLQQQSLDNISVVDFDRVGCEEMLKAVEANIGALEAIRGQKAPQKWVGAPLPNPSVFAPENTAWLMMRDSALLSLVPEEVAANYWKLETTNEWLGRLSDRTVRSRVHLSAVLRTYARVGALGPADVETLLTAFNEFGANLESYRRSLRIYGMQVARVIHGQSIDFRSVAREEANL